jgi:peptide methionine sulfoxide reductase msrA/msrB
MCNARLYQSEHKFDSSCGWPSFDNEIEGAVKRTPDADGRRTEITCAKCGAHLGHVFKGELLTEKNIRHCVNSLSLIFVENTLEDNQEVIYFAGGCFWGTEFYFRNLEGVVSTSVGYIGGKTENPTYKEICSGSTGHAEVVEVVYDKERAHLGDIVKLFFEIHDCTQINRQGPDIGEQYRSEVFYTNKEQEGITNGIIDILIAKGYEVATITTKADKYYKAEDYHQDYLNKKGTSPTCHFRNRIF